MRRWHSWVFRHKWGLAGWACVLAVALAFAWLTLKAREEARNSVCNGNLKMLSTSILSYQDRYGHFPPGPHRFAQWRSNAQLAHSHSHHARPTPACCLPI